VRETAREAPDRVHSHRLRQLLLGSVPLRDLHFEPLRLIVERFERARIVENQRNPRHKIGEQDR
jgi:hypothetical protein